MDQEQADQNRRRLQETELLVILWLLRRRDAIVRDGLRKGRALAAIAAALEPEMQVALIEARKLARAAGRTRVFEELRALGLTAMPPHDTLQALAKDARRAGKIATSYAKRWLKAAEQSDSALAASEQTEKRITLIGATENAQAYNEERVAVAREATDEEIWRVWDATLDARTCSICRAADGMIVALHESFPLGEPGDVHPNCRCSFTLTTARF